MGRATNKHRQADGIAMAIRNGVKFGHEKALTDEQVLELRQKRHEGLKIRELMTHHSPSKASVYRALGLAGAGC